MAVLEQASQQKYLSSGATPTVAKSLAPWEAAAYQEPFVVLHTKFHRLPKEDRSPTVGKDYCGSQRREKEKFSQHFQLNQREVGPLEIGKIVQLCV